MKKRICALLLTVAVTVATVLPVGAVNLPTTYDETYYATLDYYGAPVEASVVKSYQLRGASTITDYGTYDEVVNLTDGAVPELADGVLTFTPESDDAKFYFEGKTTQPFRELSWHIAVTYKLNGAPILAEDLAGKTGLVEIDVDVIPNPLAREYTRTNLVLTVATAFNDDEITSLAAPGAQIQLIGNLRAVLFAVLPGEEQHFAIQVGSESFESSGLIFLAVPATLRQLESVADLKEAKEKAEESIDDIDNSLEIILDTLEGMSGSLNATANGLDRLNSARGTVSGGKENAYNKADKALESLKKVSGGLGKLDTYNGEISRALSENLDVIRSLNGTVQSLRPCISDTKSTVLDLKNDLLELDELLNDTEKYNKRALDIATSLADALDDLEADDQSMEVQLRVLASALKNTRGVSDIGVGDVLSMLPADQAAQMREVLELHGQYEDYCQENKITSTQLSFRDFIIAGAYQQYRDAVAEQVKATLEGAGMPAEQVASTVEVLLSPVADAEMLAGAGIADPTTQAKIMAAQSQEKFLSATAISGEYVQMAQAAADAYEEFSAKTPAVSTVNKKIKEVNTLITNITGPTGAVVDTLSKLCGELGETGAVGDLVNFAELCRDLLRTLEEHQGTGTVDHLAQAADIVDRILPLADSILADVGELAGLLEDYEPTTQAALEDVEALSISLQDAITDTANALEATEDLLKASGPDLDAGTREALSGIAAALRKSTVGLGQTGNIRQAKGNITDIIDEEWDAHTGEIDGLLNMDAAATPVSMTSEKNPAPTNIQYIMRTQEIKVAKPAAEELQIEEAPATTFWGRVAAMFRGLWEDLKKLLHIG